MKPSSIFHGDNSATKNYWNSSSIVKWNKECISGAKSHVSLKLLAKIVILSVVLGGLGWFLASWLHPSTTRHTAVDQKMIVDFARNLSITNSSMTEESTTIKRLQKTSFQSSTQPSTNVIFTRDELAEKSSDEALLTKKYVRL